MTTNANITRRWIARCECYNPAHKHNGCSGRCTRRNFEGIVVRPDLPNSAVVCDECHNWTPPKPKRTRKPKYSATAFIVREGAPKLGPSILGPEDVTRIAEVEAIVHAKREQFLAIALDARHRVVHVETVSVGSLNASIVHPREMFKAMILASAAACIVVHNHPSGEVEPSEEDIAITKRLHEAGELLGITLMDHLIVGSTGTVSFRGRQML